MVQVVLSVVRAHPRGEVRMRFGVVRARLRPAGEVLPSFSLALLYLTAATATCIGAGVLLVATGPLGGLFLAYGYPILAALYAAAGLLAWWRRPVNRLGPLLVLGGFAWLAGGLQNTGLAVPIGIGKITATLPLAVVVHLLHAFPSGRLRDRPAQVVVAAVYVVGVVLEAPLWMFGPEPPPFDVVMVSARPDLALRGYHVQEWCGLAVVAATFVLLALRLREYDARQRRVLAPLFGYGVVAVLAIPVGSDLLQPVIGLQPTFAIQLVVLAGVPVSFVAVVLRGGFSRTRELGALVTSVAASAGSREELQEAVARTLGDPSAAVLRWSPEQDDYIDVAGRQIALPEPGALRAITPITIGDRRLGALVYDAQLTVDPALPTAVARVAAIALDREQLAEDAAASRRALQRASVRVLGESDRTRRQIAQDLHDGLQATLLVLSMQANLIAEDPGSPAARSTAAGLVAEVDGASAALRALVAGVMPPQLLERGLAGAVQELAYGLPVRVGLDLAQVPAALPPTVESTAYFVVSEALTNVVKHAGADRAEVSLSATGEMLRLVVSDNGRGGASRTATGLGLPGLRDRLRVLGGDLRVTSGEDGTRLEADLPYGVR